MQNYVNQRNDVLVEEFRHPSAGPRVEAHIDPEEIKHAVIVGLKRTKISGVP